MAPVPMSLLHSPCSLLYSLAFSTTVLPLLRFPPPQLPLKGVLSPHSLATLLPLNTVELWVVVAHLVLRKVVKMMV